MCVSVNYQTALEALKLGAYIEYIHPWYGTGERVYTVESMEARISEFADIQFKVFSLPELISLLEYTKRELVRSNEAMRELRRKLQAL